MKSVFVIALSVLFILVVAAYAVWRGFKNSGSCSSCSDKSGSCRIDGKNRK